ncbi:MAG: cation:proton antiporter subunit C [Rhodothalassiaceae bacterium]
MEEILAHFNFWIFAILLMLGLYATVAKSNLIKKLIGLNIFQAAVFLLYISMNKVAGGTAPIMTNTPGADKAGHGAAQEEVLYSNPLPQVLILTAIVVGISTTALGLAIAVRIKEAYGSVEEAQTKEMDLTL